MESFPFAVPSGLCIKNNANRFHEEQIKQAIPSVIIKKKTVSEMGGKGIR
jgi:hypothetical protein